jgi:putative PIN family toxin of toxin-antitoxin system
VRVVCDTNVLIQASISAQGPANAVISLVLLGKLTLLAEERIWDEYLDVLTRKRFDFARSSVDHLLRNLRRRAEVVTPLPLSKEQRKRLPDPTDAPFLEAALGGRAGVLISSNLKHFPPAACGEMIVLPPVDFIRRFVSVDETFT